MLLPAVGSRGFGVHQVRYSWTHLILNSLQSWFRFWKLIWSLNIPDNPGSKSWSHRSCIWKVSFGEQRVSSTSGMKILHKPIFESVSTRIPLLIIDLIFKRTWQCRKEIVEPSELYLKNQFRRAEGFEHIRWENPGQTWFRIHFNSDCTSESCFDLQIYLTIQNRNRGAIGAAFQNSVSESRGTALW